MKNNDKFGVIADGVFCRLGVSRVFLLVVFIGGMISGPTIVQAEDTYMVKILFDSSGCPKKPKNMKWDVDHWIHITDLKLTADKDTVYWQAYNLAGDIAGDNTYKIYFDPFKKPSAEADGNDHGKTKTRKTKPNQDIPTNVEFKYTIWADACPKGPLDPRFTVQ